MTHIPSPAALVTAALGALVGAAGLLALQIVLGLEYTTGGTLGTQASMIGAMVTLALLPVFLAIAWRSGARVIAGAIGISFAAFLFYSLPATSGRTGEIKEAKANVAEDVARWQAEHDENAKQLRWAVPDKNGECVGAPNPLPPNGWPVCRRKTGTVTALEERQAKLEADIKAAGTAGVTGDLGSTLWAWALSWAGLTAAAIRKGSVIAFAVGLDFAIWSLVALAEHLFSLAMRTIRERKRQQAREAAVKPALTTAPVDTLGQSDYPALDVAVLADHPARADAPERLRGASDAHFASARKDRPEGRMDGGTKPERRPKPASPDGRTDSLKADVLAYIREELADGRSVPSNVALVGLFGGKRSTVSDWLGEWERSGVIPARRTVGRCKAIVPEARKAGVPA